MSEETATLQVTIPQNPAKTLRLTLNGPESMLETGPRLTALSLDTIEVTHEMFDSLSSYEISVIESTKAGRHSSYSSFYTAILKPLFSALNIRHSYLQTTSASSLQEYAAAADLSRPSAKLLYLFLSGDTSVFEFVNCLFPRIQDTEISGYSGSTPNVTILPFPHGTGNALCNSLKLFNDIESIKALFRLCPRHLPLYQLQSHTKLESKNPSLDHFSQKKSIFFLVVASWCLHSTLVFESDKPEMRAKYGPERFRIAAMKILEKNPHFRARITFQPDSKSLFYNHGSGSWLSDTSKTSSSEQVTDLSYFLLAAVSNFEKTFMISPHSVVAEDQLHILAIPHIPSDDIMTLMNAAYDSGTHVQDKRVYYSSLEKSSSLELIISDEMHPSLSTICLDGSSWEVTGKDRKLTFSTVQQSFLHFLS